MGLTVCPVAVVAAPVDVVWRNLVQCERYFEWANVQVEWSEPEGPASAGQTIYFAGKAFGRTMRFTFKVEEVNPERNQLGLHAFFPLGLLPLVYIFRRWDHPLSPGCALIATCAPSPCQTSGEVNSRSAEVSSSTFSPEA